MPFCSWEPYDEEIMELFRRQQNHQNHNSKVHFVVGKIKCDSLEQQPLKLPTLLFLSICFSVNHKSNHKRLEQNLLIILDISSELCNIILLLTKLPRVPQGLTLHSVGECSGSRKIKYQEPGRAHARTSCNVL